MTKILCKAVILFRELNALEASIRSTASVSSPTIRNCLRDYMTCACALAALYATKHFYFEFKCEVRKLISLTDKYIYPQVACISEASNVLSNLMYTKISSQ